MGTVDRSDSRIRRAIRAVLAILRAIYADVQAEYQRVWVELYEWVNAHERESDDG